MKGNFLKYLMILLLLFVYVNRGIFIAPCEYLHDKKEVNSVIEFLLEKITGHSNDIDEDGDGGSQETGNSAKVIQPLIAQQIVISLDFYHIFSKKAEKFCIPQKENIPKLFILGRIDEPPNV